MGLIRAGINVTKAAMKGGSGKDIGIAAAKGMLPRSMGSVVDKLASDENISRVQQGIRNVSDNGRRGTFSDNAPRPTGAGAPPPPPGSNSTPTRPRPSGPGAPPPPPGSTSSDDIWGDNTGNWKPNSDSGKFNW